MVARGDHQEGLDYHTCPLQCNENVPEGITPPQEPVAVDRHPHPKGDYRENVAAEHQIAAVLVTGRGLAAENISPADRRLVGLVANLAVLCWPWQRRDHVCEETKRVPQGNEGHQPDGRGDSVLADLVRVRRECWHQEHRQNNHGKVEVHGELVRPLPAGIHLGDPLKPKILKRRQLHMAAECEVAVRALRQIPNHEHNYGDMGQLATKIAPSSFNRSPTSRQYPREQTVRHREDHPAHPPLPTPACISSRSGCAAWKLSFRSLITVRFPGGAAGRRCADEEMCDVRARGPPGFAAGSAEHLLERLNGRGSGRRSRRSPVPVVC
eukprot:CAMPEP_0182912802 /NCGR_PEP_ID=MMETSP0034_2-20130328/37707_1 /TAXON_ID=156128 /ORGANISM="Nephroselmis pyriformis, Strain CCMP717" /LENGTH=323 /DNA_ID=CAMNT_0025049495 /DNA_START=193 /DNA_END=1162 /DNA_ORIENTATION=+